MKLLNSRLGSIFSEHLGDDSLFTSIGSDEKSAIGLVITPLSCDNKREIVMQIWRKLFYMNR